MTVEARVLGGRYRRESVLGQGGMAVVYAARHLVSGRTRALKIARTEDSAEEALRGEYQVLENAWIYAGYRRSDADFENASSVPIDSGIHLGMRFTF